MNMDDQTAPDGVDDAAILAEVMAADVSKTEAPETTADPVVETPAPPQIEQPKDRETNRVPVGELIEERRQRQALERQMQELIAQMKANQPAPPAVQPAEIWDNPNEFVKAQVASDFERQQQVITYNARLIAEARFTEQAVNDAIAAFDAQLEAGKLHPADHAKVMNSPNQFAEAVKWHQSHKIISEVGMDPAAYKAKLEAELLNDPEFRKKMMAQLQQQAASQPSRQSPPIALPSLSKVGATALSSNDDAQDDASLWKSVTSARKR